MRRPGIFGIAIIYVLRLEQRKFYVGKTNLPVQERFLQHKYGRGAEWTRKYPPIAIELEKLESSPYCEDNIVKQFMEMFGIENVRGGSYSKVDLDAFQLEALQREILHANDLCLGCGLPGHFLVDCPLSQAKEACQSWDQQEMISFGNVLDVDGVACLLCGRGGHLTRNCNFVSDRPFIKQQKATQPFLNLPAALTKKLIRTREDIPYSERRPRPQNAQFRSKSNACYRCGRQGHWASKCTSKFHIHGHLLPDNQE